MIKAWIQQTYHAGIYCPISKTVFHNQLIVSLGWVGGGGGGGVTVFLTSTLIKDIMFF